VTSWSKELPYNRLPDLPPRGFLVQGDIADALIRTRVALARADQAAAMMPNPEVLITGISIAEAQASSEIENIVTTKDALFESLASGSRERNLATAQAIEYRRALLSGADEVTLRPIGYPFMVRAASTILGYRTELRSTPGTFIGGPSSKVVYTPPEGTELIAKKLDALIDFVSRSKLDPLIRVALAHYQFEAIHPFPDGNGRLGRVLNVLWLCQLGVIQQPVISPSLQINSSRSKYYRLLERATSRGEYQNFVLYMLESFEAAADKTLLQVKQLSEAQRLVSETKSKVFSQGVGANLARLLFLQAYARISHLVEQLGYSRPTAAKYLEELVRLGFLKVQVRGRDKYFVNHGMLEII
jgi:Fic family protein